MPALTRSNSMTIGTRTIEAGEELRITGEPRNRYRFLAHVASSAGTEWVDLWGPHKGATGHRSVPIDRIRPLPKKRGQ